MGVVISATVFTKKDLAGNPWVEGFFLVEFRDARYTPGGESFDLSSYMRRVEYVQAQPVSGALDYEPRPSYTDFPANAGSGRLALYYLRSSIVASGQTFTVSGVLPQLGVAPGQLRMEILSGLAVSGARATLIVLGT